MPHCLLCAIYLKALCHISRVCYWKTISLLFRLCEPGPCPCSMKCIEPNLYIVNTNMVHWCIYRSHCSLQYSQRYNIREVKDCLAFQESSMAINMLVMRVNQAQKVKETVNNLLLSIAPRVHRVRRGNTKENIQSCKFSF